MGTILLLVRSKESSMAVVQVLLSHIDLTIGFELSFFEAGHLRLV
jgi:hypothetical protein